MIRSIVFWVHLASGIAAGLVILIMSVTGVLLTYERQIVAFADRAALADERPRHAAFAEELPRDGVVPEEPAADGAVAEERAREGTVAGHRPQRAAVGEALPDPARRPLEAALAAVQAAEPSFKASAISVPSDPSAAISVRAGRAGALYVDRQSGRVLGEGAADVRAFFREVEAWHRWFGVDGERRGIARAFTGAANFVFFCLVVSGLYLWLPRVARWAAFKGRLLFVRKPRSGKARDFNWHHVIGFWSAIPLAVIAGSAVVFSYGWANDLVYAAFGESPPARGERGARSERVAPAGASESLPRLSLDELLAHAAAATAGEWRTMTIDTSRESSVVGIEIDRGNGGQPQLRSRLTLDASTGAILAAEPFSSQSPGRRARSMLRFLHTGEALGVAGQTIAGVVSAASLMMVWTGWALAYRRLLRPLFARRRSSV